MAEIVMILGESGSGKSASLRNFEPGEVCVLNVAGKRLPFRNREKRRCSVRKNRMRCRFWQKFVERAAYGCADCNYRRKALKSQGKYLFSPWKKPMGISGENICPGRGCRRQ